MRGSTLFLLVSLFINLIFTAIIGYKYYNNWFEISVLKEPFRRSIFEELPNERNKIYFVGDSHTEAFELAEFFNNPQVRNRGIWGDMTSGVLSRLDGIIENKPRKVFIMIGVNDICSGKPTAEICRNAEQIIHRLQTGSPKTQIFLQSVLPTDQKILHSEESALRSVEELNACYKQLSTRKGITYLNLFPSFLEKGGLKKEYSFDGLHMNGKGYAKWKSLLVSYL